MSRETIVLTVIGDVHSVELERDGDIVIMRCSGILITPDEAEQYGRAILAAAERARAVEAQLRQLMEPE